MIFRRGNSAGSNVDALGARIEAEFRFTPFKLASHCGAFAFEIEDPLAIVRAFAQHKLFDDGVEGLSGQFGVRNFHGYGLKQSLPTGTNRQFRGVA